MNVGGDERTRPASEPGSRGHRADLTASGVRAGTVRHMFRARAAGTAGPGAAPEYERDQITPVPGTGSRLEVAAR